MSCEYLEPFADQVLPGHPLLWLLEDALQGQDIVQVRIWSACSC